MKATEKRLVEWLESFVAQFQPLERELTEAWWQASTTGRREDESLAVRAEKRYRRFLASPERYRQLQACPASDIRQVHLRRQHKLVAALLERHMMDDDAIDRVARLVVEIESEFNNFRATIAGERVTNNRLKEMLRKATTSATAREAWEASKQIAPRVEAQVIELVRLRNNAARARGHRNYHVMSLTLNELEPGLLFSLLDDLEKATERPYRELKAALDRELAERFGVTAKDLRPWHYGDPFFQSTPQTGAFDLDAFYHRKDLAQLALRFYDGIGLDVRDILDRSDIYERPGKCQHAFCTDIDREGDIRVLCNVRSDEDWMRTMLHEFGHAVYDKYVDPELPFLLRQHAHTLTTEAVAMLFGRLSRHRGFLESVVEADPRAARSAASAGREELRRQQLIFLRWALVVVQFERELYRDPEQDLDTLWWELVERLQLLRRPPGRQAPDWAAKIHLATAPVYYQNYILGELAASQLEWKLRQVLPRDADSLVDQPAAGRFLKERIFHPGKLYPWNELTRRATGQLLSPRFFCQQFA